MMGMTKSRFDRLTERGLTATTVYEDGRFEALKKVLLSAGGCAVIFVTKELEHYDELVNKGKFILGKIATKVGGIPGNCHQNVEKLVKKKAYLKHMYGFALSEDGVWREHSWAIKDDESYVLETTELRTMYYGIQI